MIQTPVLQTHRWLTQSHDGLVDFVHVCCPIDFIGTTPIIKSKPVLKCLHDQGLGKAGLLKTKMGAKHPTPSDLQWTLGPRSLQVILCPVLMDFNVPKFL